MYDPDFEASIDQIRGFDLGDDAALLAQLEARPSSVRSESDWLLHGVLLYRADRIDDAAESLDHVTRAPASSRALYLKSCMLREHARMGEALEVLEEARASASEDGPISTAQLDHAQALLYWRAGNLEDALRLLDRAIEAEGGSASRWLHRGQLLAQLGRTEPAAEAFDRALDESQDLDWAMYEHAALAAERDDAATAAEWLGKAVRLQPELRARVADDPRFSTVIEAPALAALVETARPADAAWLDGLAPWLAALRRDSTVTALGVSWLGRAHSDRIAEALGTAHARDGGPAGLMHTAATLEHARALLQTRRAVALGPGTRTREGALERSLLFLDTARPQDGLWLALSESYPPFLWIPITPRHDALRTALAEHFPRPARRRADLPAESRGFLGYRGRFVVPSPYTGGLEPATIHELDRHFAINPFVESAAWGSAYDEDPWPDEIPAQPDLALKIAHHQRLLSEQARGHVWSRTRRTRHSRSLLSVEVHQPDMFVAEVRYRPSQHAAVVEAMNTHFGSDYPVDMPVDAVAALLGFQFDGVRDLQTRLGQTEDPEQIAGLLLVIAALRHGDLGVQSLLRGYLEHDDPGVRTAVAEIAMAYNYESLLEEMSLREPDPELRSEIEAVLDEGLEVPDDDPWADDGAEVEDDEAEELDPAELVDDDDEAEALDDADVDVEDDGGAAPSAAAPAGGKGSRP